MTYIYYQIKIQMSNTGDVMINKALLEHLKKYGKLKCNCNKDMPQDFIKSLELQDDEKINCGNSLAYFFKILKHAISAKKRGDKIYLVFGVGHHFGGSLKLYIKNIVVGLMFLIYKMFGVKMLKIGMTIGPITKAFGKTEKFRSRFIDYYYVRDTKSYELCKNFKINKVQLCPDMSWLYLAKTNRKLNDSNIITITLRDSTLNQVNNIYMDELINNCSKIVQKIIETSSKKMKIRFFYQVKRDKEFCKKVYNIFNDKYDCEFIDKQITLFELNEIYEDSAYNISNRMHSILLGYKYGSLPIALIDTKNHIKISQTLKDNKLDDFIIDVYDFNEQKVNNIINNRDKMYKKLIETEKQNSNEIVDILDKIFIK